MKKVLVLLIVILVFVGGYTAIYLKNNSIRDNYFQAVKSIELPIDWEVLASEAECGKIFGNGNGMQYSVAILVRGERPSEAWHPDMWIDSCEDFLVETYYYFPNIHAVISDLTDPQNCFVLVFLADIDNFGTVLELDIRGH